MFMQGSTILQHFVFMQVLRCSKIASVKVSEITELINKALENDRKIRYVCLQFKMILSV